MNLEKQVCSLELAKKLLTLGVNQNSIFVWEYYDDQCHAVKYIPYAIYPDNINNFKIYSAFTAAELFELLPQWVNTNKDEPFNHFRFRVERAHICKDDTIESLSSHFICNYYCDSTECSGENAFFQRKLILHNFYSENLADCLAQMLIYLIENNLMDLPNENT